MVRRGVGANLGVRPTDGRTHGSAPTSMRLIPAFAGMTAVFFLCGFGFVSAVKNERGNHYYKKGQLGKAKSAYESALKSDPKSGVIAFNLGNAYYREESFDKSLENYTTASVNEKSMPLKARAYYNVGNAYVRKNQTDKAVESYRQALRLNPGDEDAKFNLELLKKKSEQEKKDQKKQDQAKQEQQKPEQQKDQQKNQQQEQQQQNQQQQDQQQMQGQQQEQQQGPQQGRESADQSKEGKDREAQGRDPREESPEEKQRNKTQAEIRADQILDALENQEKQVLRLSGQKNPVTRARRVTDKDW